MPPGPLPMVLSAKTRPALGAQAARLREHLERHPDIDLVDVAFSLATTRAHFEHRAALVAHDRDELLDALRSLAEGTVNQDPAIGRTLRGGGRLVFVFPGQGSQWTGMARSLLATSPVFRDEIEACARALEPHVDWPVLPVLRGDDEAASLDRVDVVQPALFAVMAALAALWRSVGVTPDAVVGHSQGEIAAAYVAGALCLDDAAKIVALRSRALTRLTGRGAMASVELGGDEIERRYLSRFGGLSIAAVNSATTTVVSGDADAVDALLRALADDQVLAGRIRVDYASHSGQVEAIRDELIHQLADLAPRSSTVPLHSTVTGEVLDGRELDADYWYRNLRLTVRFAEATESLIGTGHRFFVEVSPHPVLAQSLAGREPGLATVGSLRRDDGGHARFLRSVGELHTRGLPIDWPRLLPGGNRIDLPTYAFQRERFWPASATTKRPGSTPPGQVALAHPFLDTAITSADHGGVLFAGHLSLDDHAWLADHTVFGTVILPGAALVDLALFTGRHVGLDHVEELTSHSAIALTERSVLLIQLAVSDIDDTGRRSLTVHTRSEAASPESPWTRHVTGVLAAAPVASAVDLRTWPPRGATPVPLGDLYERASRSGLSYGDGFRALAAVWREGEALFAEVVLPEAMARDAENHTLHPVLLDAALHALLTQLDDVPAAATVALPFSWAGVSVRAVGASRARVRLTRTQAGDVEVSMADATGEPLASVRALHTRPVSPAALGASLAAQRPTLRHVTWDEEPASPAAAGLRVERYGGPEALLDALERESPLPDVAIVSLITRVPAPGGRELIDATHDVVTRLLALLQTWLADSRTLSSRLVLLTRGAVATRPDEDVPDLVHAPLWGLVRTAQLENPGHRIRLCDIDDSTASRVALPAAVLGSPEAPSAQLLVGDQFALRDGRRLVPRLKHLDAVEPRPERPPDPDGTVLITGGTGTLGALLAYHLVRRHGVRHLLLLSRRGAAARDADLLVQRLEAEGASVTVAVCDVADRQDLAARLAAIPPEHPLTSVVHAAGVLDDGVLTELSPARLATVLTAKLDAAVHLHELTRQHDLTAFVVFSSVAGIAGSAGQGNYAAANSFLDGLAQHRAARGLPACSIAWGYWQTPSGLTRHLTDADTRRLRGRGLGALSADDALALFDAALGRPEPVLVAARLDRVEAPRARADNAAPATSPRRRLLDLDAADREPAALELVSREAAAVLRLGGPRDVAPDRPLQELGLDSLMAVELRNRLASTVDLALPATLLFEHPTPAALARFLIAHVLGVDPEPPRRSVPTPIADDDLIAIVSMSCRLPGEVRSPEELWQLLLSEKDAISDFPANRGWNLDTLYDPDPTAAGRSYVRQGGFLHDADRFDASFFGIGPTDASTIDPQQRLLLEITWEALERGGIVPATLRGSDTGVFVGVMYQDYGARLAGAVEQPELEAGIGLGSAGSVASGRIAYTFGLEGPAVSIDTACSSSLVALHLACQSLRQGEATMALAGGVTVMATPSTFIEFSRQRGLSPDGRCRSFSADANGTGWSEGAAMLVLERLSDARRNGHPVLALIRGSSVNQDGKSQGLTAPSGTAQERVIERALASAGLTAGDVDAVEAHGTATTLGDPIEARALLATYGRGHTSDRPLRVGALKSAIGHTQAASGVAGVIKMVLAMRHGLLPRTLHADVPSPHVDWSPGTVELLTSATVWESRDRPLRAGVSSFGVSGTNAHVILEQSPTTSPGPSSSSPARGARLFPLSGATGAALSAQADRLRAQVESDRAPDLTDLSHSLAATRTHFDHRAVVVAHDHDSLSRGLLALAHGRPATNVVVGRAAPRTKLVFVFPGQGAQWPGMARSLLNTSPVFREQVEACSRALEPHVGWSPLALLGEDTDELSRWGRVDVVQPALFTVMVSLAALWRSLGVEPDAVVGHSQGEIAAAYVAGALTLEDAARVVALRSRALAGLAGQGTMAAVELSTEALEDRLLRFGTRAWIAGVNGPHSCLVSGDPSAIEELVAELSADSVFARTIRVDYASHGPAIEAVQDELDVSLDGLTPRTGTLPMHSTVTAERIDGIDLDGGYWYRNLRHRVRFDEAVQGLLTTGHGVFVEVSPHPVLGLVLREALRTHRVTGAVVGSLHRDDGELERVLLSLGELHAHGHPVDWPAVAPGGRVVELPTYAFQRDRYWLDPAPPRAAAAERSFWSAVESADLTGLIDELDVDESEGHALADLLPALARWRGKWSRPEVATIQHGHPSARAEREDTVRPTVDRAPVTRPTEVDELRSRPPLAAAYVAPATDLELLLTGVWQQVLGIDEIGAHDNFFELGGSSLQAGQVLTRLRTTFPVDIRFDLFFGNPTIAGLAPLVEDCLVAHLAELTDDEAEQLLNSVTSLSGDA